MKRFFAMLNNYVVFFITVAFAVSCCMLVFLNILANTMGIEFTEHNIAAAAKLTFGNVLLIAFIFSGFDYLRRKLAVERPVKIITDTTGKIMQGDFSARVPAMSGAAVEGFDRIGTAINHMARELESVETLRTDFIANVSHELKTPLAVMQNYGTLLQQPGLSEDKRLEYARAVTAASRRLADMVSNILKLNRLENQQIFPKAQEYDLGEQLCQCLLEYEQLWEERDMEIETDIAENVRVRADRELLSLVWSNLLSNAFKFTPPGGKVSLSLSATDSHATVTVRDTGCGMSAETGEHIFEKFYQGDGSHATEGNGLGLALVKRVVDIVQGEISVESEAGRGTSFTVRIGRG